MGFDMQHHSYFEQRGILTCNITVPLSKGGFDM